MITASVSGSPVRTGYSMASAPKLIWNVTSSVPVSVKVTQLSNGAVVSFQQSNEAGAALCPVTPSAVCDAPPNKYVYQIEAKQEGRNPVVQTYVLDIKA